MPDESIEDILSELQPHSKDDKLKKLMEELEESPRSVVQSPISREDGLQPIRKKDQLLDNILEDIAQRKINSDTSPPTEKVKPPQMDHGMPGELKRNLGKQNTNLAHNDRAKAWLKELDPASSEGLWFKEFAKHYASELEAALDYLQ